MKLTRVALENFRCFGEATFDLTQPGSGEPLDVVLLVGGNGSGKSAFLQAICGLFSQMWPAYGGERPLSRDVRQGMNVAKVEAHWLDSKLPGDNAYGPLQSKWTMIDSWDAGAGMKTGVDLPEEWLRGLDVPRRPTGLIVAFDVYRLLPARRVSGPNTDATLQHRCESALTPTIRADGTTRPRAQELKQWIVNLDYLRAKSKADKGRELPLWEILRRALDTLLHPYTFEGVDDDFQVLFGTPSGRVPIESLSDGFRSTFTIVSDLLLRLHLCTDAPERLLEQEAVCLIDEVDAHLHPRWQETIIPGLRALFPNVQFIATTHSPLVVSSVEPENVFRLEAEDP